ncbi:MAG: hypothetical protein LC794_15005 [Acidobacteria bacterium]|nr:hypothetical protein [Acidobacteriota bacterium]
MMIAIVVTGIIAIGDGVGLEAVRRAVELLIAGQVARLPRRLDADDPPLVAPVPVHECAEVAQVLVLVPLQPVALGRAARGGSRRCRPRPTRPFN